ncbi:MAG TPA: hypothetical protein VL084_00355 [Thermoanaerobaculia bacterium]|nr:hypothetical protein [Thermoanaerobaculia bacterium]
MKNGGSPGPSPAPTEEPLLSLQLRLPDRLLVPDLENSKSGDGVIFHVEIRNRTDHPWESRAVVGPLLEIVLLAESGEVPLVVRQLPMLAYPAALAPGRGFLLPVRILITDVPRSGATYRLRIRMTPGAEETYGTLRFEPRA